MKLHEILSGSTIYVRPAGSDTFVEYNTKETKTYYAEQFQTLSSVELADEYHYTAHINLQKNGSIVQERIIQDEYAFVAQDGFEAIVHQGSMNLYCNIQQED